MSETVIASLFDDWNAALKSRDPSKVVALYASDAILLPTVSNQVRHNPQEIESYFVDFVAKGPSGKIDQSNIRVFDHLAINSGVYTFSFDDQTEVQARYTFVYRRQGDRWMIIEHHSSKMPESP